AARLPFRGARGRVEALRLAAELLRQDRGDRGRQRGLAVVNVTDRTDVYVRLSPLELTLSHIDFLKSEPRNRNGIRTDTEPSQAECSVVPMTWIEHVAAPLPRECSTTELHGP